MTRTSTTTATLSRRVPNAVTLARLFAGGLAALLVWEIFSGPITTWVIGGPLEPPALIVSLFQNLLGINPGRTLATIIHWATGIAFYPIGYYLLTRFVIRLGMVVDGLIWGVITWFLALGLFASLAGLPFMLNWIPLAWMSGLGHVIYGLVGAVVFELLERRSRS